MIYTKILILHLLYLSRSVLARSTTNTEDSDVDDLVVNTTTGFVRGGYGGTTFGKNKTIYWFRSIPYAEPPIGDLRFEPPVPKKRWEGILDATEDEPDCIQGSGPTTGSEDCLLLKIYTTKLPRDPSTKLPVMVYIHGGAFLMGRPNLTDYNPDDLLDEDILIVAPHYRLGIFGFLTTGDLVVPGNNGLKDQVLALKWIKENIEKFGGDSNNITLFGQSSGGISVSYLVQTKQTKGLFRRAIMQSGTTLCLWSYFRQGLELTKRIAEAFEVDTTTSETTVAGLKSINAEILQQTQLTIYLGLLLTSDLRAGLVIGAVLEPEHEGALFTEKSYVALQKGHFNPVPLLIGHTSLEAYLSDFPDFLRFTLISYDLLPSGLAPIDMNLVGHEIRRNIVGRLIKKAYFGNKLVSQSNDEFLLFLSDDFFERPTQESVRLYSSRVPVYYFIFSYEGRLGGVQNRTKKGVGHNEDMGYIFDLGFEGDEKDYVVRNRVVKMWTNFIKTGNPTPEKDALLQDVIWEPNKRNSKNLKCLDIGENLALIKNPNFKRMKMWQYLYNIFAIPPFDTY